MTMCYTTWLLLCNNVLLYYLVDIVLQCVVVLLGYYCVAMCCCATWLLLCNNVLLYYLVDIV